MIDIHSHILYGIDDGAKDIGSSLDLIDNQPGVTAIIATPHYSKPDHFLSSPETNQKLLKELQKETETTLKLGNELFIDASLDELLETGDVLTLAGSRYVLVEFPMGSYRDVYDEWLYNITISGYKLIIAHPERYAYVQENFEFCQRWVKEGYLLQSNADSLKDKRKRIIIDKLLKNGWLYFLASDAHNSFRNPKLKEAYEDISKSYSAEIADRLLEKNPRAVIEDGVIDEMPRAKKRFWLF